MPHAHENPPRPSGAGRFVRLLLLVSLPLYVLDQATKWLVTREIAVAEPVPVIPGWFELVYFTNTGAAWGIFKDSNRGFLVLSIVALIVLAVLYRRGAFDQPLARVGFFLLIPGVLGNLTDRLARGHVVDFLLFDLHVPLANPWPSFNVADSCICLAVAGFVLGSFQDLRRPAASQ
jgi:signal peptidase II